MNQVELIRNGLIEKIRTIQNKDLLEALDDIVSNSRSDQEVIELSEAQKALLQLGEDDLAAGRTIPHESVMQKAREWLKKQ